MFGVRAWGPRPYLNAYKLFLLDALSSGKAGVGADLRTDSAVFARYALAIGYYSIDPPINLLRMLFMTKIFSGRLTQNELESFLRRPFSNMIKFVVDVERKTIALGGQLHSDAEFLLLEAGSAQEDLWGGNLHFGKTQKPFVEFTSLINIRPSQGNTSLEVKDELLQDQMRSVLRKLLP